MLDKYLPNMGIVDLLPIENNCNKIKKTNCSKD